MPPDPRLDDARRERELATMQDPGRWPMRTLPLKRFSYREDGEVDDARFGRLEATGGVVRPVVLVEGQGSPAIEYPSFAAIHEDGWLVD